MRQRQAGNSFLILLIGLFVVLCVAIFWLALRGHGGGALGTGIAGLAAVAPAETCVFVGVDLRDSKQFETMLAKLRAVSARPKVAEQLEQMKQEVGLSPEEMAAIFEPDMMLAIVPLEGRASLLPASDSQVNEPFEFVLAVGVRDEEKARQAVNNLLEKGKAKATRSEEHGQEIFLVDDGPNQWAYHLGGKVLFLASGREPLVRMLETASKKKPSLAENPTFKEALGKVPVAGGSEAALMFVNLKQSLSGWEKDMAMGPTPEQAASINGLQYLVLGAGSGQSGGFFKVDPGQSKLLQTLVKAQSVPNTSVKLVPAEWGNYSTFNLPWLYANILELVRLSPGGNEGVANLEEMMAGTLGLPVADLFKALDGEVAITSDALETLEAGEPEKTDEQKKLDAHSGCITNEKNLATALEMYATDWSGRYPASLAPLAPNYMKIIPNCPSAEKNTYSESYEVAAEPDAFTIYCRGNFHGNADYPQYSSYQGLIDPDYGKVLARNDSSSEPEPTFVLLLGVKDVELFNKLLDGLMARGGMIGRQLGKPIGDTPVYVLPGGQGEWTLVSKPSPVALFAFGPKPHEALEKALGAPGKSVGDTPQYSAMVTRAGANWIALGYQDLGAILKTFSEAIGSGPMVGEDEAEMAAIIQDVIKDAGDIKEASFASVEPDGLKIGGGGASGSLLLVGAVGAAVAVPNFVRARGQGQLTACKSNQKNIATACEMYATDFGGRYPERLSGLTPNYLRTIPECPAAGADTYSATYQMSASPDMFSLYCQGENHVNVGVPANYPQYNGYSGLIER